MNRPLKIYLGDLTYDTIEISTEAMPLNIGFVASYCLEKFGKNVEITLFKYISELENAVISVVKNGIMISEIVKILEYDKFDIVSAVSRLIYQKEKLYIKTKNELNLKVLIFIK